MSFGLLGVPQFLFYSLSGPSPKKSHCGENHGFNIVYMSMCCFQYALRQTMCKLKGQYHCWVFSP